MKSRFEIRKTKLAKMVEVQAPDLIVTTEAVMLAEIYYGGTEKLIEHLQKRQQENVENQKLINLHRHLKI